MKSIDYRLLAKRIVKKIEEDFPHAFDFLKHNT